FFFLLISSCRTLPGCPALPQPRYLARGCGRPASSRHPHGSPRAPPPGSHRARPRPRPHAWGAPAEPARPYRGELGARHLYICDFHKNLIQSVRNRRKRKGSDDDGDSPVQDIDTPEVDLYQLQVNTLRRYKRHFKLQTRPGLNKAQLVEIIGCHFRTIPVNEKDTLTYFIYSVKNDKNKPDLKMDSGVH
uniref:Sin3A associated protein 30 n=1 Tax=Anas platyrhynchos platyrhynchos TaxID=8840 RepID=U3I672_ANAPP